MGRASVFLIIMADQETVEKEGKRKELKTPQKVVKAISKPARVRISNMMLQKLTFNIRRADDVYEGVELGGRESLHWAFLEDYGPYVSQLKAQGRLMITTIKE